MVWALARPRLGRINRRSFCWTGTGSIGSARARRTGSPCRSPVSCTYRRGSAPTIRRFLYGRGWGCCPVPAGVRRSRRRGARKKLFKTSRPSWPAPYVFLLPPSGRSDDLLIPAARPPCRSQHTCRATVGCGVPCPCPQQLELGSWYSRRALSGLVRVL